ncbi:unnamed protein product [Amoebophrya sp. A120]|nr:unnamed protein product [Amoebophrya sp. A120]|eukprot:GSA120T00016631001.1
MVVSLSSRASARLNCFPRPAFKKYALCYLFGATAKFSFSTNLVRGSPTDEKMWYATTTDNHDASENIKKALTSLGLPVNVRNVYSHFWWDGKLDNAVEARIEVEFSDTSQSETIAKAITENHSDDVPMLLTHQQWNDLPEHACYQAVFTRKAGASKAADLRDLGKQVVEKRFAGCSQHDNDGGLLFVKTTGESLPKVKNFFESQGNVEEVSTTLVDANKDYHSWLYEQTAEPGSSKPDAGEDQKANETNATKSKSDEL